MIKVHVIPAEVGAHIGLLGAFAIAEAVNAQGTHGANAVCAGQSVGMAAVRS
jgi:hypothetical protein